jgi:hypothetical protein
MPPIRTRRASKPFNVRWEKMEAARPARTMTMVRGRKFALVIRMRLRKKRAFLD